MKMLRDSRRVIGPKPTSARLASAAALAVGALLPAWVARAGKIQGAHVTYGSAAFQHNGNTTTIRTSNRVVIDYTQFDVPAGSSVVFQQPSTKSTALNRIDSATPSSINGSVSANGTVYFVNPAGVTFGPHAQIAAAGVVAAAGTLSTADYLAGAGPVATTGVVTNAGTIHAASVQLAGKQVINTGQIVATGGVATIVAGDTVYLGDRNGALMVKAPAAGSKSGPSAAGSLAAGDLYSLAINQAGSVKAANITVQAASGQVQVSGTLDASGSTPGTKGGTAKVLTPGSIALAGAKIDASGPAGGGTILVGGNLHGAAGTPRSTQTAVDAASTLLASATQIGNGGKVVVWSVLNTIYHGAIAATGGPKGGNGGTVETSGGTLDITGAKVIANGGPGGKAGNWLLDPFNVIILPDGWSDYPPGDPREADTTNAGYNGMLDASGNLIPPASAPQTTISVKQINAALNNDMNVTIDASKGPAATTYPGGNSSLGAIYVDGLIDKSSGTGSPTLTLFGPSQVKFAGPTAQLDEVSGGVDYGPTVADAGKSGVAAGGTTPYAGRLPATAVSTPVLINYNSGIMCSSGKLSVVIKTDDQTPSGTSYGQVFLGGPIITNGGSLMIDVQPLSNGMSSGTYQNISGTGLSNTFVAVPARTIDPTNLTPAQESAFLNKYGLTTSSLSLVANNQVVPSQVVGSSAGIDTAASVAGAGGEVEIIEPRVAIIACPISTGGGSVTINNDGGADGSPAIYSTSATDPNRPQVQVLRTIDSGGGSVSISSPGNIYVTQVITDGGNFTAAAGSSLPDSDGFSLIDQAPYAGKLGSETGLSAPPITNETAINTGQGSISITGPQIELRDTTYAGVPAISGGDQTYKIVKSAGATSVQTLSIQVGPVPNGYSIQENGNGKVIEFSGPVVTGPAHGTTAGALRIYTVTPQGSKKQNSADIVFDNSIGGPVSLNVDAGPHGTISFPAAAGGFQSGSATADKPTYAIGEVPTDFTTYSDDSVASVKLRAANVSLGSIYSVANVDVQASNIVIAGRSAVLVAGGSFDFSSTPKRAAKYGGFYPRFGTGEYPSRSGDVNANIEGFDRQEAGINERNDASSVPVFGAGDGIGVFNYGGALVMYTVPVQSLYLAANIPRVGLSSLSASVASSIAGAISPVPPPARRPAAAPNAAQKEVLAEIGINAKLDEGPAVAAALSAYQFYNDVPMSAEAQAGSYVVSAGRLSAGDVELVVKEYKKLFWPKGWENDTKFTQTLDQLKPEQRDQRSQQLNTHWNGMRETLTRAAKEFPFDQPAAGPGAKAALDRAALQFRQKVKWAAATNENDRNADRILRGVHDLFDDIHNLGLGRREENGSRTQILSLIAPESGITDAQLIAAIEVDDADMRPQPPARPKPVQVKAADPAARPVAMR